MRNAHAMVSTRVGLLFKIRAFLKRNPTKLQAFKEYQHTEAQDTVDQAYRVFTFPQSKAIMPRLRALNDSKGQSQRARPSESPSVPCEDASYQMCPQQVDAMQWIHHQHAWQQGTRHAGLHCKHTKNEEAGIHSLTSRKNNYRKHALLFLLLLNVSNTLF